MYVLGVIPARAGSKRIPGKNTKMLCGKPLIAWTIEAARKSKLHACIVSTDSKEVAKVAEKWGGWVPFKRPPELATDDAKTVDVAIHALRWFEEEEKKIPTHIAVLQPTSPLRRFSHINEGLTMIKRDDVGSVVTISRSTRKPNGCLYITSREMLLMDQRLWDCLGWVWPMEDDMPDIDTEEDWKEAERLLGGR